MTPQPRTIVALSLSTAALLVPAIVSIWNSYFGGLLFFLGLLVAVGCLGTLRAKAREQRLALASGPSAHVGRGRTILVALVDEQGQALAPHIAAERMALAQRSAGPRDTVLGVHHPVPPTTEPAMSDPSATQAPSQHRLGRASVGLALGACVACLGVIATGAALIQSAITVENVSSVLTQLTLILIACLFLGITGIGLGIGASICRERSWGWAVAGIVVNMCVSLFVVLVLALGSR